MINLCDSSDEEIFGRSDGANQRKKDGGGPSTSAAAIDLTVCPGGHSVGNDERPCDPSLADLMQLGFPTEYAKRALKVAGGNKELAAQYLLDGTVESQEQLLSQTYGRGEARSTAYAHMPMSFLLDDKDFYKACRNAHRHERGLSAQAVLESVRQLAKKKPEFIQLMVANPDRVIDLIANFEE